MCISEKLNSNRKFIIAAAEKIDYLITELPPDNSLLVPYKSAGIQVM